MKTIIRHIAGVVLMALFISLPGIIRAQNEVKDYVTVSGTVRDNTSGKYLQYAHITVKGTNVGTITNVDGEFSLKVKDSLKADKVEVSLMGYHNYQISIGKKDITNLKVMLKPMPNLLEEITIYGVDAKKLVADAIDILDRWADPE